MTKEIRFFASVINCYTENEVITIGIGNDPISPDRYFILSRFDDSEIDDSIGIQTHTSEIEVINAIDNIVLKQNSLKIDIKKNKNNEVFARKIVIDFDNIDMNLLVKYIKEIFSGSSVKVTIDI